MMESQSRGYTQGTVHKTTAKAGMKEKWKVESRRNLSMKVVDSIRQRATASPAAPAQSGQKVTVPGERMHSYGSQLELC